MRVPLLATPRPLPRCHTRGIQQRRLLWRNGGHGAHLAVAPMSPVCSGVRKVSSSLAPWAGGVPGSLPASAASAADERGGVMNVSTSPPAPPSVVM